MQRFYMVSFACFMCLHICMYLFASLMFLIWRFVSQNLLPGQPVSDVVKLMLSDVK